MKKINEVFVCLACETKVPPAEHTCRNHCPICFLSLHVDKLVPGDRASDCGARMVPIGYEHKHGVLKICFSCTGCDHIHRNKRAIDDQIDKLPLAIEHRQLYQHTGSYISPCSW